MTYIFLHMMSMPKVLAPFLLPFERLPTCHVWEEQKEPSFSSLLWHYYCHGLPVTARPPATRNVPMQPYIEQRCKEMTYEYLLLLFTSYWATPAAAATSSLLYDMSINYYYIIFPARWFSTLPPHVAIFAIFFTVFAFIVLLYIYCLHMMSDMSYIERDEHIKDIMLRAFNTITNAVSFSTLLFFSRQDIIQRWYLF